jgi:hypothetical protein
MPRKPTPLAVAKAEAKAARTSMALQLEKFKRETDQKDLILGRMEGSIANTCDAMAQLSEFPMDQPEVDRLRKICDVMLDLRRAMIKFAFEHDDLLRGIRHRPGREFPRISRS